MLFEDLYGVHHRSTGVDFIIHKEHIPTLDIADNGQGIRVRYIRGTPFFDESQACIDQVCVNPAFLGKAQIGGDHHRIVQGWCQLYEVFL